MITYLTKYEWSYQYSIFIDINSYELDEAKLHAMNWLHEFEDSKFKDYLRKRNPNVGMMYVVRKSISKSHPSHKTFQQYYITIYTTDSINGYHQATNYSKFDLNTLNRKVSLSKILSTCSALKNQRLHNLSSLGSKKRFSILNKSRLLPIIG